MNHSRQKFYHFITRGLRIQFLSASIMPFVFGSLIDKYNFNFKGFIFGLMAVVFTHLFANLINDYADSRSGVDWEDKNFYKFFGGSKLIQENILSEKFYLAMSVLFAILAIFAVVMLSFNLKKVSVMFYYMIILILSWAYSCKPFKFSYRYFGELLIFILFGPALVMGGYFIQTGIFPDIRSLLLSFPFGFLTTAILFVNEIPDFKDDIKAKKFTLVNLVGVDKAFLFYYTLFFLVFFLIVVNLILRYIRLWAVISFLLIPYIHKAATVLRKYPEDKTRLVESSKLTIVASFWISAILILGVVL